MRLKTLILLLIVIVLVSLSWFKLVAAQDLSSLSDEEKLRLLKEHQKELTQGIESNYYQSPEVLDEVFNQKAAKRSSPASASPENSPQVKPSSTSRMPDYDELRPFGTELFGSPQETEPPADIASAADYILGPGDNVIIYLWGRVEKAYNLTLDREGKVFVPRVGQIIAWGLTLEQFTHKVKEQFSKVYSDFDITVSLGKVRSIRIYVTGEVQKPGAYTVSSLTSLFNAIYIAGGPNGRGSMRNIKLMRKGRPKEVVDLYNLLLAGDNSTDIKLRTGDVIFVPVAGAMVAIRGEVKRSALYELKGGETALDLLALAGNPTPEAYLDRVMLERISDAGEWEVLDLNLNVEKSDSTNNVTLKDGDHLTVFSIFDVNTNMVAICGRVKHSGYYERNDSTRVSDLVSRGQLRPYDVYYERADLFRRYPDRRVEVIPINLTEILSGNGEHDILLQNRDSLYVYSIDQVQRDKFVYVEGEINSPGRYPLYDHMTVQDLIFLSGSFAPGAYRHQAEIARMDSLGEVSLLYVNLDGAGDQQVFLQKEDHVYIRQIPEWQLDRTVAVEGEVVYPGKYTLSSREETLHHLLRRAGGFTENAFPEGIVFYRQSIESQLSRQRVPELLEKSRPLVKDSLGNLVRQNVFDYDFGQMGRVIIDIDKIITTEGKQGNIVLEPGDRIYVPSVPSGISVIGAVGANGTIKFSEGRNVKYYIERAGNFTRQADKKEVRLMRAGGEVISGRGTLGKRVMLGDVVVVPAKIEKERNWLKTFASAVSATTGILTSVYIISKL